MILMFYIRICLINHDIDVLYQDMSDNHDIDVLYQDMSDNHDIDVLYQNMSDKSRY